MSLPRSRIPFEWSSTSPPTYPHPATPFSPKRTTEPPRWLVGSLFIWISNNLHFALFYGFSVSWASGSSCGCSSPAFDASPGCTCKLCRTWEKIAAQKDCLYQRKSGPRVPRFNQMCFAKDRMFDSPSFPDQPFEKNFDVEPETPPAVVIPRDQPSHLGNMNNFSWVTVLVCIT